ncbi:MAG: AbrB/MazE/SpoVT family DNA-binding domain-containing protein [Clostridia bacterium]|nr:AbrB/MazE/SpoVT family DNA-binding domain-containing protein [Clostridia bacterium]MBR2926923.1 AbrB/MazE/SpoVT family DNA-binding domain-containing protein [Clostridia bacterium]
MKSTGIVRKVDELGRFVLPSELRQEMGIEVKSSLEIFTENGRIILQKHQPSCVFCKSSKQIVVFKEQRVCRSCIEKLQGEL